MAETGGDDLAAAIIGCGALRRALDVIGAHGCTDATMAKIICENELALRVLLGFALTKLAQAHNA